MACPADPVECEPTSILDESLDDVVDYQRFASCLVYPEVTHLPVESLDPCQGAWCIDNEVELSRKNHYFDVRLVEQLFHDAGDGLHKVGAQRVEHGAAGGLVVHGVWDDTQGRLHLLVHQLVEVVVARADHVVMVEHLHRLPGGRTAKATAVAALLSGLDFRQNVVEVDAERERVYVPLEVPPLVRGLIPEAVLDEVLCL